MQNNILIAAGGTGGHLFPAQALAEQLKREGAQLLFAGTNLSCNPYFNKEEYRFCDVASATPFRGGWLKALQAGLILWRGFRRSCQLLSQEKPALVIGFGSFHTFPLLCAAIFKKIPLVLFESNAVPGKVVRLFSKRAVFTGLYFPQAKSALRGKTYEVDIPHRRPNKMLKQEARERLGIKPDLPTLLVFGGSQGAKAINAAVLNSLGLLKGPFQLVHLTGHAESVLKVMDLCEHLAIPCCVKRFEPQMHLAWSAADVVLCRSGAITLSEMIHYEVPGLLIPYPSASDQHQLKNALFFEKEVGGAIPLLESEATPALIAQHLNDLLFSEAPQRQAITAYKARQKKGIFCQLIREQL